MGLEWVQVTKDVTGKQTESGSIAWTKRSASASESFGIAMLWRDVDDRPGSVSKRFVWSDIRCACISCLWLVAPGFGLDPPGFLGGSDYRVHGPSHESRLDVQGRRPANAHTDQTSHVGANRRQG